MEPLFDGQTATLIDGDGNRYAKAPLTGTVADLAMRAHSGEGLALPGADLLLPDIHAALAADVLSAKYVGLGVIAGRECEHLAFRNADTDWPLWVAAGGTPAPCRLTITSKTVTGGPQYTLTIRAFEPGVAVADADFALVAPAGATEVALPALAALDELPPPAAPFPLLEQGR